MSLFKIEYMFFIIIYTYDMLHNLMKTVKITDLSRDLLCIIGLYLKNKSVLNVALCCKRIKNIFMHENYMLKLMNNNLTFIYENCIQSSYNEVYVYNILPNGNKHGMYRKFYDYDLKCKELYYNGIICFTKTWYNYHDTGIHYYHENGNARYVYTEEIDTNGTIYNYIDEFHKSGVLIKQLYFENNVLVNEDDSLDGFI